MSRYIDAELLIEAMQGRKFANDECMRHGTDSLSKEYYRHLQFEDGIMMGFVREQPTADVKPVIHGKWKRRIVDNGFNADWVCSECGLRVKTESPIAFDYCPKCGADMREVQE